MKKILQYILLVMSVVSCKPEARNFLENLMRSHSERFEVVLANKDKYEVQIIYTQIDRDASNAAHFTTYRFNVDSSRYFYPASTVKLPVALLSLEKLQSLGIEGLDKYTPVFHDRVFSGQISVDTDTTSQTKLPSIEHYIKKILVASDNDAYNRLYEFLGQEAINTSLASKGYHDVRILHRLERFLSLEENQRTETISFVKEDDTVYAEPMKVNTHPYVASSRILKGEGFIRNDSLINEPFDFTYKNSFPLAEQHEMLKALIFPESAEKTKKFLISESDRQFILKYMSQLPRETVYPAYYKDTTYHDAYCKFLLFGGKQKTIPATIRIFNKIGDAYGYLIDNAYIVDFENGVEFMLSAVINTNTDGVYNDGKYDYEALGYPFMKNLGEVIYEYELQRKRVNRPNLSAFRYSYDR